MERINIAELLKDCPKGMELNCSMFNGVYFDHVDDLRLNSIKCYVNNGNEHFEITLDEYGQYISNKSAKCVIFPKGKTTWEEFHRPFKDGDIVAYVNPHRANLQVFIFKSKKENNTLSSCYLMLDGDELDLKEGMYYVTRLATEEEKQKLFDALKTNGYKWNEETKTLDKLIEPKFKVGDKVESIFNKNQYIITDLTDTHYTLENANKFKYTEPIIEDKNWELVPNKFDINTLKPFESKVLVRDSQSTKWLPAIWGFYNEDICDYHYVVTGGQIYRYCIPYEGNEHLFKTTNDCDDYYKNWK